MLLFEAVCLTGLAEIALDLEAGLKVRVVAISAVPQEYAVGSPLRMTSDVLLDADIRAVQECSPLLLQQQFRLDGVGIEIAMDGSVVCDERAGIHPVFSLFEELVTAPETDGLRLDALIGLLLECAAQLQLDAI